MVIDYSFPTEPFYAVVYYQTEESAKNDSMPWLSKSNYFKTKQAGILWAARTLKRTLGASCASVIREEDGELVWQRDA